VGYNDTFDASSSWAVLRWEWIRSSSRSGRKALSRR